MAELVPADTRAPLLSLSGNKKQSNKKKVEVKATPDEASSLEADGTFKVPTLKNGKVKPKEKFDLKGADADLAAGETGTLKLEFKKKAVGLVKKALKAKETSKAKVTVTATDASGNSSEDKFSIKVKK